MEKRFESLTIFDFQKMFPDEKSCLDYLESNGFYSCFEEQACFCNLHYIHHNKKNIGN
ncbi:MAG: hypothetical protein M3Q58_16280 [Bacteroidota bacterium]|nr:hypothetical protein [Bacteroidota bacterium]